MIRIESVSHWYGNVVALSDISLEIGPGVTGLLGPNGAGKSSLIKLLTAQMKPRMGRVTIGDRPPWRCPHTLATVGYAPEGDVYYKGLTGRVFVQSLLGLSGYGRRQAKQLAGAAIEKVGLLDAADRPIAGYSKGMKQRVKVAQAIAHDPDYLLLDEPFEGTDPVARRQLIDLVADLGASGKVVVLSSHVLHEVEQITRQIVLLGNGKVLASGKLAEIRSLLDAYPLMLQLGGPRLRRVAAELIQLPSVMNLELDQEDTKLLIRTREPQECYERIARLGAEGEIDQLICPDESLEAVFEYLTGQRSR